MSDNCLYPSHRYWSRSITTTTLPLSAGLMMIRLLLLSSCNATTSSGQRFGWTRSIWKLLSKWLMSAAMRVVSSAGSVPAAGTQCDLGVNGGGTESFLCSKYVANFNFLWYCCKSHLPCSIRFVLLPFVGMKFRPLFKSEICGGVNVTCLDRIKTFLFPSCEVRFEGTFSLPAHTSVAA